MIDVRSKEAPNSLSAKLKKFVVNAKHSVDAIYHESGTQTVASSIHPSSFENAHKGDIHIEVKLDNGEIFRQQIPLHQAYQSNKIIIEQNKLGGELLW